MRPLQGNLGFVIEEAVLRRRCGIPAIIRFCLINAAICSIAFLERLISNVGCSKRSRTCADHISILHCLSKRSATATNAICHRRRCRRVLVIYFFPDPFASLITRLFHSSSGITDKSTAYGVRVINIALTSFMSARVPSGFPDGFGLCILFLLNIIYPLV